MKKYIVVGILLMLVITAIPTIANSEDDPFVTDLIAGQNMDVGDIEVWDDGTTLYVKYIITEENWVMTESHVHIGFSLDDFPLTKKGNPKVGKFDYKMEHDPPLTEYTYTIPYNGETFIAAHAVVWGDYICYETGIVYGMERSTGKVWGIDVLAGTAWFEFQTVAPTPSTISPNGFGYDEINARFYYVDYTEGPLPEQLYFWDGTNEYIAGELPHQIAAADCYNGKYYYVPSWPGTDDLYEVTFDASGYIVTITKLADISDGAHGWTFDGDIAVKDGIVYGWGKCTIDNKYEFFTYNLGTGVFTLYTVSYHSSLQLAFGSDGVLYGHRSGGAGAFYIIDTTSGGVTMVTPTPNPPNLYTDCASGMICEPTEPTAETAWGDGEDFNGKNWAMYFEYNQILNNKPVEREINLKGLIQLLYMKIARILEQLKII